MVASEDIEDAYCPVDEKDKLRQRVLWGYSRCNTFANLQCRPDIPKEFTIHSLWRDNGYYWGPPLVNTVFESKNINKNLREQKMKKCWSSMDLYNGEAVNRGYFETQKITGVILTDFPPGPTQILSLMEFKRSISTKNMKNVFVKCNTNKDGEQQLQEIGIYYRYKGGKWSIIDHPKQLEYLINVVSN
ncbi:hypothetical protein MKX03_013473 [Papaver bracteatum]|nr:hypothetical protein MKX03_013473 [Papaver bracteatum]